jgi:hypothetical protein
VIFLSKILLFIPGYNCEKQIVRVLNQLDESVMKYITQVIFINNRSTDNTESNALEFKRKNKEFPLKIFRNDKNYNLGGSHKVAFNYAIENNFDYIIVLHGDDQGNIHDFLPLLKSREYEKYDSVLGARFMKDSKLKGYSKIRTFGNRVFNKFFSILVRDRVYDLGSGLNLYKVESLKKIPYIKYPDTLYFNDLMILSSCHYKMKTLFYPITWREEDQVSNNKLVKFSINLLKMLSKYTFTRKKFMNSDMRNYKNIDYSYKVIEKEGK